MLEHLFISLIMNNAMEVGPYRPMQGKCKLHKNISKLPRILTLFKQM